MKSADLRKQVRLRARHRTPRAVFIDIVPSFKVGDPPPKDPTAYLAWHEWARVQHNGGLRQNRCTRCKLWFYPQESEAHKDCKERD